LEWAFLKAKSQFEESQINTTLLATSWKNSFDQTFSASGFFTKGSTSFRAWFTSNFLIAFDMKAMNFSRVKSSPGFACYFLSQLFDHLSYRSPEDSV